MKFTFKCPIVSDKPTSSGRIYPKEVIEKMVKEYNENKEKFVYSDGNNDLTNLVGNINHLDCNSNGIYADAEIYNTPKGKIIQDIIANNVKFNITPVVLGHSDGKIIKDASIMYMTLIPVDDNNQ